MATNRRRRSPAPQAETRAPKPATRVPQVATPTQHLQWAVAALEADDGARAARHLDAVISLAPSNPDVRALRGIAANRTGDFPRAVRDLGAAVRAFGEPTPETRDAHNEYALALRGIDDDGAAEAVLRALVAAQPDFGTAWHNLAMVLHARGESGALDEAV